MVLMRVIISGLLVAAAGLAGCNDPLLEQRRAKRAENLQVSWARIASLEDGRQESLDYTVSLIKRQYERDKEMTRLNGERVHRAIDDEFTDWQEAKPRHRARWDELMAGDPATINRTWPLMVE